MTHPPLTTHHLDSFRHELLTKTGNHFYPGADMPHDVAEYCGVNAPEKITLYNICNTNMRITFIICRSAADTDREEPERIRRQFANSMAENAGYRVSVLLIGDYPYNV